MSFFGLAIDDANLERPIGAVGRLERSAPSTARTARLPSNLTALLAACAEQPERVLFLDVETTGLSHFYDEITVIGWSYKGRASTIVKGDCHRALVEDARDAVAIITFNGIRFDSRFLRAEYPDVVLPQHHLDLMYLCRRAGLKGGQKAIEKALGIELRTKVDGIDGLAAVTLWHRYVRGDVGALEGLVRYNRADIAAMGAILDRVLVCLDVAPDLFVGDVCFEKWAGPCGLEELPTFEPRKADDLRQLDFKSLLGNGPASSARIVGIDLTGSEARGSGWCLLDGDKCQVATVFTDRDLIDRTMSSRPDLISIDSPLCLPSGRTSVDDADPGRERFGIMRECERELKRRGVNVYPCLLPSMQKLTARGMLLAEEFRRRGVPVIESYPGAAQDIMRIPRKGAGVEWLRLGLEEFGLKGDFGEATHDELDAATSALVGSFHWAGLSESLGTADEPPLIIPMLSGAPHRLLIGISGPIAAGKTTLARELEALGFAYARFSEVIDDELRARGLPLDRIERQRLGAEIHRTGRQRWLAGRTLARVGDAERVVIDGLRFADDHAFFGEIMGGSYLHVFVDADEALRRERYALRSDDDFSVAASADVESGIEILRGLAHRRLVNCATRDTVAAEARDLAAI
ncbi:ribonuclease H-like domain-containing protein [Aurantimonas sp. VKM B-3413]|uniref:ribonuclease H-like domain-containing protein n=1 Tax=Aurantimonas sp. VKM B-3413 TaxID=2779401 RepID=UPI001E4444CB|nr:DUF429 domain-containing protein [Aurantimonas sp. VKM B-3413]